MEVNESVMIGGASDEEVTTLVCSESQLNDGKWRRER